MGERTRELLILIVGDAACFLVSLWLTLFIRYLELPGAERFEMHLGPFFILTAVWLALFFSAGLYDKHTTLLKQTLQNKILYTQIANFIIAAVLFMVIPFGIAPKTNLVIYLLISTAVLSWWRLSGFHFFSPKEKHKAVLIADGPEAIELADEINNNDRYNYSFVRIVGSEAAAKTSDLGAKLTGFIEKEQIKIVVVSSKEPYAQTLMPTLFNLSFLNFRIDFIDFTSLYEDTFDKVPVSVLGYEWFVTHVAQGEAPLYAALKRAIDIAGVFTLAIPTALIFPVVAVMIKLEDGGPLFYFTDRVGQFNKIIRICKFRTMTGRDEGTDALNSRLRVTKVGAFMRKTRIDELPQLYNVLIGDLSFIGPRPEMPAIAAVYAREIPFYNVRHYIKPGLSGWAQINDVDAPRGGVDIERTLSKLSYDLLYVKRRSLLLDCNIALKTLAALVMRTGV